MTVTVPKWAMWIASALVMLAAIVAAFLLGRSTDAGSAGSAGSERAPSPPCTKAEAEQATLGSDFGDAIAATSRAQSALNGYPSPPRELVFEPGGGLQVAILECEDLTGDGVHEMTVALAEGATAKIGHWAIFEAQQTGKWEPAFFREGSEIRSLNVKDGVVTVRTPIYALNAPVCCPSGSRNLMVEHTGEGFAPSFAANARERLIETEEGAVIGLGELDTNTASGAQAVQAFGQPTSATGTGETCVFAWDDLGLVLNLVNLGGADSCGPEGRIGTIELLGSSAEQAGWHTDEGVEIGTSLDELRAHQPDLTKKDGVYILAQQSTAFGEGGVTPSITAHVGNAEVVALSLYVGAGGE